MMRRPEVALLCLALGVYAYFYQAGGWNQNSRFDLTRAIVEKRTSVIDGYHRNTGDHAKTDGHYYCDKAPGASWLAAVPYALIHAVAGSEKPSRRYLDMSAYLVTVWSVAMPSAAGVVALVLLLAALGVGLRVRLAIGAAYAFGTLAFPYATLLYGHQLMAALLVIGFAPLVRARRRMLDGGDPPRPAVLVAAGLALGYAVVVEYPAALAVLPIFVYACAFLWRSGWKHIAWLAVGGAIAAVALAAYHWIVFGGPLTLPYDFSTQSHRGQGFMGIGAPRDGATWGVTFSSYRGLFYSAPWLLLSIPGAALLWRAHRRAAPEIIVCAVIAVLTLWLNVSLVDWQGGWALGPRYLILALPFMAVLCAGVLEAIPRAWPRPARVGAWLAFGALAGYAAFLMLAGTAVKPEVPVYEKRPWQRFVFPQFYAGDLAVSTQSIDMKGAPKTAPRAAWNLGHALGLSGKTSLVPLALFVLAALAWLWLGLRSMDQGP